MTIDGCCLALTADNAIHAISIYLIKSKYRGHTFPSIYICIKRITEFGRTILFHNKGQQVLQNMLFCIACFDLQGHVEHEQRACPCGVWDTRFIAFLTLNFKKSLKELPHSLF